MAEVLGFAVAPAGALLRQRLDLFAQRPQLPSRGTPKRFREDNQLWSPDGRAIAFNRTYTGSGRRYGTLDAYRTAAAKGGVYVVRGGGRPKRLLASEPHTAEQQGRRRVVASE